MIGIFSPLSFDISAIVPLQCITEYDFHFKVLMVIVGLIVMNGTFATSYICFSLWSVAQTSTRARGYANRTAFVWIGFNYVRYTKASARNADKARNEMA